MIIPRPILAALPIVSCCSCLLLAGALTSARRSQVHVLSGFDVPESGIFPTDAFTVPDDQHGTGLRVNLTFPDCSVHVSDCRDTALINTLDGFNVQPRVTVPFDGDIDPASVNSGNVFFVELGVEGQSRVIGVNQLVWDPATRVLAAESDEQLKQHTRYAFVVTTGVLDASGAALAPAPGLGHLGEGSSRRSLLQALAELRDLDISGGHVAGLSVFTTQSTTAILEHLRDAIKSTTPEPVDFLLGPGGIRTVFPLADIRSIDWQQQISVSPPAFQSFRPQYVGETDPLLLLDQYAAGAVGRIAYGRFRSPRYIADEPFMPSVGTRQGLPPVRGIDTLYLNVFLPAGAPPPDGWPVVVFGLGGGDYKEELPWFYAANFAAHGIATACINVVGHAYGPLSYLTVTMADRSIVRLRSGGRGADLDGNGVIANNEGVSTISPTLGSVGARDAIRQQAVDLMQLVRVLEGGVDVEGDGIVDLDPSRISYFGISFGAGAFGPLLMAVDPAVKVGVLASPGGLNSRFDLLRLRPSARSQVGSALAARVPSLLNPPGLTTWAGIPVAPPFFNENIPLRDQAIVTDAVDGAMDIQRYFDRVEWITNSGDGVSYAPHLSRDPLAGMPRKTMLVNFGKGDQSAPNPRTTQLIRAGGLGKVTTFYRNDLAYAEDNSVLKNPHTYLQRWMLAGLSGPIARVGLDQVGIFLASRGRTIVTPEPARFFEVPIARPLPEDFSYIR